MVEQQLAIVPTCTPKHESEISTLASVYVSEAVSTTDQIFLSLLE